MKEIFKFGIFKEFPEIVHGVSTNGFGNMSFKYGEPDEVKKNRKKFFDALGIDQNQVVAAQLEHKDTILNATGADRGKGINDPGSSPLFDILITRESDTYLFFVVADCLALFLYEPDKQVCALVHAGWKGVDIEVPKKAISHMVEQYGCVPGSIIVGMSPSLQVQSAKYLDISPQQKEPRWQDFIKTKEGHFYVNSLQYAYHQLMEAGIKADNIERSDIDTYSDRRFYSHRRCEVEGRCDNRFGCVIGRKS